jgi:catechol 2,3-dioxygenase-like lactoylglutathione lyase family enzyme
MSSIYAVTPMLVVADVRKSAAFYEEILGLPLRDTFTPEGRDTPSWASLRQSAAELMLSAGPEAPAAGSRAQLYVRVDHVGRIAERAKAAGVAVRGPFVRFYGMKEIELRDPDGVLVIVGEETEEPPTPE